MSRERINSSAESTNCWTLCSRRLYTTDASRWRTWHAVVSADHRCEWVSRDSKFFYQSWEINFSEFENSRAVSTEMCHLICSAWTSATFNWSQTMPNRAEQNIIGEEPAPYHSVFTARAMLARSVHLSVRPSVHHTHALWLIQRTYRWYFFISHERAIILVFCCQRSQRNSNGVTLNGGAKESWGRLKRRSSTNIWLYLTNGALST